MDFLSVAAPAKLNLSLRVIGRRADGYHLIESLMVPIDLYDTVSLTPIEGGRVSLEVPRHPELENPRNLAVRAARAFFEAAGVPPLERGAAIRIEKRIPVAAGMGGGSSDAAAVLLLLQRYHQAPLTVKELDLLALSLGADVPFFLRGFSCWATGVGETLDGPVELPEWGFLVCAPPRGQSTAEVYARLKYPLTSVPAGARARPLRIDGTGLAALPGNDLEAVTVPSAPDLSQAMEVLRGLGPLMTRMTGSGPASFAVFPCFDDARQAQEPARDRLPGFFCAAASVHAEVRP